MVKDELGRDAVILHTKRYRQGGFLGYKSKEVVEVTAAVDDAPRRPRVKLPSPSRRRTRAEVPPPAPSAPPLPRQVLSQYKTAGTEEGVSLARSAELFARLGEASAEMAFIPMEPTPPLKARRAAPPPLPVYPVEVAHSATTQMHSGAMAGAVSPSAPQMQPMTVPVVSAPSNVGASLTEFASQPVTPAASEPPPPRILKAAAKVPPPVIATAANQAAMSVAAPAMEPMSVPAAVPMAAPPPPPAATSSEAEVAASARESGEKIQALEDELAQMRKMLRQVMRQPRAEDEILSLQDALKAQAINEQVMQDMIRKIPQAMLLAPHDSEEAHKALGEYLHGALKTGTGIGLKDGRPKIVALIGTTGVGKTTTIAKIAARFVLEKGVSVALITADTYRISAVDQLRTYSDIIGLPLEIVYSAAELKSAIKKHKDKKLILIDTAGRSQNNEYQMQELKEFLEEDPSIEKHLVLSATTKERDAEKIMERFSACRPDRVLFTKTDETDNLGFIVNLLFDRRIALSYFTNGQSVPDDIEPARPEVLARLLLR